MRSWVIGFLCGGSLVINLSVLPIWLWVWVILFLLALTCYYSRRFYLRSLLLGIIFGFSWILLHAQLQLNNAFPKSLEGQTIVVAGIISSIPVQQDHGSSFEFDIQQLFNKPILLPEPLRVRLNLRKSDEPLFVGDKWQFCVRLKRPHGYSNVGSFDYERWLFEHHIRATGYIVACSQNKLLQSQFMRMPLARIRQTIANKIAYELKEQQFIGFISALAVGVRDAITQPQWQVMQYTGTNHLMAIAGLHIGFVAGITYTVLQLIWRRLGKSCLCWPAPQVAAAGALLAAIAYSALAGFALPTQRAVIMLVVFLIGVLGRKNLPPWSAWCLALFIILIIEPLAILSDSFWLSFGAVAIIIYGISGRLKQENWWWKWGRTQWVVALGLLPLTLLFFHQASLVGFLANAIAIPWVEFLVLPLCVIGGLLLLPFPSLGQGLLIAANQLLLWLWPILQWLAHFQMAQWLHYIIQWWILLSAIIAVLLLLAPRGFPARWLSIIWSLPVLLWKPIGPGINEVWFSLLDVGQGLAAVIRTAHHTLVFDTGPRFSNSFDAGSAIVVPFLQAQGINQIDQLIISHPDNDHIGGAKSVLKELSVKQLITSDPSYFSKGYAQACLQGQSWNWDGVLFQFIYPNLDELGNDNDSSCVLRVDNHGNSLLLTGDIERHSEHYLLSHNAALLPATILVAPHHGSRTSSSEKFITAIHPQYVLFPIGYRNRYKFPNAVIIERYLNSQAKLYDTVHSGTLTFSMKAAEPVAIPFQYRKKYQKFWYSEN